MPDAWHLGNDIVDLTDPRHSGKAGDQRFLRRVFTPDERDGIQASREPDLAVWARWAGKEAAFKTISKFLGAPPVFVHTQYCVSLAPAPDVPSPDTLPVPPPRTLFGEVDYEDTTLPLRIEMAEGVLHALTWLPGREGSRPVFSWGYRGIPEEDRPWREGLRSRFTPHEWECVSHRASAHARLAARTALAGTLGLEEEELEIRCGSGMPGRRIPMVFLAGRELPVDLTLSHHGGLLAWAFVPPSLMS